MGSLSSKPQGGYCGDSSCTALVAYDERAASESRVHHCSDFVKASALVDKLQPGDIIQFKGNFLSTGTFYSHFAVYIGNGDIVHVVMADDKSSSKAKIEREKLEEAAKDRLVRKANLFDDCQGFKPKSYAEIIRFARDQVDQGWEYDLLKNNCEHFATLCRYGKRRSMQSWGLGDLFEGRIGLEEFIFQSIGRSFLQHCDTFTSWLKRKLLALQSGAPAITY